MKAFLVGTFLLFASFCFAAVSLDEIVKLSESKTGDDVILQLIQKEGIDKPITSNDVVYLKQHGVSDRVVKYLMKLSSKRESAIALPRQEGESTQVSDNVRAYYTTGKNGKKVRVLTNLDKNGKRMGGEVLPEPEPEQSQARAPQEVRVIVENQPRSYDDYYERPEPQYPDQDYVDERYLPPSAYPPSYLQYYPPYVPYYNPYPHNRPHRQVDPNQPNWNYDQHLDRPRPQPQPRPGRVVPGPGGSGTRPRIVRSK